MNLNRPPLAINLDENDNQVVTQVITRSQVRSVAAQQQQGNDDIVRLQS